jgi:hypothetical protein
MQTGIAVHNTDQEQGNLMNINSNYGSSHKEKRMNIITKALSLAVPVTLGLTLATQAVQAAENVWTLKTDDTHTVLAVRENKLFIEELKNPAQGWNWTPKPSQVPLLAQVVVGDAPRPLAWSFREATTASDKNGTTLTLRFTSADPALELKSFWRARPGVGPVEHQISVVNKTAGPIVFQGENVEAANLTLVADKPVQFFPLDQAVVGPGERTPLPYQIVKVGAAHGIYFAYDYGCGQYKATRDQQDPLRLNCRFWVGNKVSTTIASGDTTIVAGKTVFSCLDADGGNNAWWRGPLGPGGGQGGQGRATDRKAMVRIVTADIADPAAVRILCDRNLLQEAGPASDIYVEQYLNGMDPFLFAGCYHGSAAWFGGMMGSMTPSGNRLFIQSATHLRCIGDPAVKYDWNPQSRPAHITKALETKTPSTKQP